MQKYTLTGTIVGAFLAAALGSLPANAQATRTWVSGVGNDADPCSRTAPCKTFAGAISKTAPFGEINCLDPDGAGAVTITKSISIVCDYTEGGILASLGTTGIIINAAPTDIVTLKGLDIEGVATGNHGINVIQVGALHVHKTQIRGFRSGGNGINFAPTNTGAELYVADSYITDNGNSGTTGGILVRPTGSGTAKIMINRVQVENNSSGIIASASGASTTIQGLVRDSNVSGSTNNGITTSSTGANVNLMIDNVAVEGNANGLVASGTGAGMLVGRSSITANTTAVSATAPAAILSYGDNLVNGNTGGEAFSPGSPIAKK
jgi:hypothetical protein